MATKNLSKNRAQKKKTATLLLCLVVISAARSSVGTDIPLRLEHTIPLPTVGGRIDHMAMDRDNQRLFVAALGNNTVEVIDLRMGKRIRSIGGLHDPQGVFYDNELRKLYVTNGGDGALDIFDGDTYRLINTLKFSDDADNIRYDTQAKYLYVGYGAGAISIIDGKTGKIIGDIKLAGHPESFQLEKSGPRIFINIPTADQITVVDRNTRSVIAIWQLEGARTNFPMALDEEHHRLFVGCRHPAKIIVYDTGSGRKTAEMNIAGDVDDIFYDAARKRIYASSGQGFLNVIQLREVEHYDTITSTPTAVGARTSIFVPEHNRLYIAIPRHAGRQAEIRIYKIENGIR